MLRNGNVLGSCFSGENVFANPRLGIFLDPTSSVSWVCECVDMVVCYECTPMMWGTKLQ